MVHETFAAAGLRPFPCWTRPNGKGGYDKGPAVPKGTSWRDAHRLHSLDWSSGVVGLPVPDGVVVLDLDAYKGTTRADVEAVLGPIPWDAAHIQNTISGGQHYAFRCAVDTDNQVQAGGIAGLDTRAAGKGFICAGAGYTPVGHGPIAMSMPAMLPELPPRAVEALRPPERTPAPSKGTTYAPATDTTIVEALRHIDPGELRPEWVLVGFALRSHYADDEVTGLDVWRAWSAGEYWHDGCPSNYDERAVDYEWSKFKADGKTTAGTLFHKALAGGWSPPTSFDPAVAFGAGAAPSDTYAGLVDRINAEGGNAKEVPAVLDAIRTAGCNELQVTVLTALLKDVAAGSGIKGKKFTDLIDRATASSPSLNASPYGKVDSGNAAYFTETHFPDDGLCVSSDEIFAYNGKVWDAVSAAELNALVSKAMAPWGVQTSKAAAVAKMVAQLAPRRKAEPPPPFKIVFNNGILDLRAGTLSSHDKELFTTALLPYDYDPQAACPEWHAFLDQIFDDRGRIDLLQEWMGYLMTRDNSFQKVLLMLGPKRAGKGTIGHLLKHLVGEANFSGGSLKSFTEPSFFDGIYRKSLVFVGDSAKRVTGNLAEDVAERIKMISGGDDISFNRKFLPQMSSPVSARIVIASNTVPHLFDDSGALASRIVILPFYKSYLDREDRGLEGRLMAELAGIAAWAIKGWQRLDANGRFTIPDTSREEAAQLEEAFSPISRFIEERCVLSEGLRTTSDEAYRAYVEWASELGDVATTHKAFSADLKTMTLGSGVRLGKHWFPDLSRNARGFKGLGLKAAISDNVVTAFRQ